MEKIRLVTMRNGDIDVAEVLWATRLGKGHYRLENEPVSPCHSFGGQVRTIFSEGIETWRGEAPTDDGEPLEMAA